MSDLTVSRVIPIIITYFLVMFWLKKLSGVNKWECKSVIFGGEIYAFEGIAGGIISVSVLNPQTLLWRHYKLEMPRELSGHYHHRNILEAAAYGGLIYFFFADYADILTHDPKSCALKKLELGIGKEITHSCVINDLWYLMDGDGLMHTFNFSTHEWSKTSVQIPPSWAYGVKCIAFGPKMYLWGGRRRIVYTTDDHNLCGCDDYVIYDRYFYDCDVYAFDTRNNSFEVIDARGDIPVGRTEHCMFLYDGKIFVFGGSNENGVNAEETCGLTLASLRHSSKRSLNQFFCFDIDTRIWKRCNPFGSVGLAAGHTLQDACFETMGSLAFCFGGYIEDTNGRFIGCNPDLLILDLELTLKGFCIQELMKNKDFEISKLPPGLRRNFIQQGKENKTNKRKKTGQKEEKKLHVDILQQEKRTRRTTL